MPDMDDIKHDPDPLITRLRNMAQQENVFEWDAATFNEAADEIERLRAIITRQGMELLIAHSEALGLYDLTTLPAKEAT
jgi:hypothetical protein